MATSLGLDIGSNSVGSAWVDMETSAIVFGVSVFPAGVQESETKRGEPKNQTRRQKRSQRRSIRRRAERKKRLRQILSEAGLLPQDAAALDALFQSDPWTLRREGLDRALTSHEFGRVLVHLGQRRGAWGKDDNEEADGKEEKKPGKKTKEKKGTVTSAIDRTNTLLMDQTRGTRTFGELVANLRDERRATKDKRYADAIRNRRDSFEFHAERRMIRAEFEMLWKRQREFGGVLAALLTDDTKRRLYDETGNETWRCKGALFGQRRTFWDTGTLGRCDLEPTDHRCPIGDRHAQAFRVLETANNIRVQKRGEPERPLTDEERHKVIDAMRRQKTASAKTVRKALGLDKKNIKAFYTFNIERDEGRKLNTDWFYRAIVLGVFGEDLWLGLPEKQRESVNRALLKFDPDNDLDVRKLHGGAQAWWGLGADSADKLIEAWKTRPSTNKRINLSRRALINLLPYIENGLTVTEARQKFASDPDSAASPDQRARYAFTVNEAVKTAVANDVGTERAEQMLRQRGINKDARQFLAKHPDSLPPPPMLANPVVRKAIHAVRRHINTYIELFDRRPDRIVIEMAREAYQTAKVRNAVLASNRKREAVRKKIVAEFNLSESSPNQQRAAVDRVLLCRQQKEQCPYSDRHFTEKEAAEGTDCELDHIVPRSRGGDSGLNNLVLVERLANREKGNRTPREWLDQDKFELVLQRMGHMGKSSGNDYFTKGNFKRKWENLNETMSAEKEKRWRASQLTSTAYAATQVAEYLQGALYRDDAPGKRRIFFTNGRYTAMLRRDWQLYETGLLESTGDVSNPRARLSNKDRTDHRHHAVDAAVIALTDAKIVQEAAGARAWQVTEFERTGKTPKRPLIPPPAQWNTIEALRDAIVKPVFGDRNDNTGLIVCHRPVKRKLVGALHKDTAFGVDNERDSLFVTRIKVEELSGRRLSMNDDKPGRGGLGPVRDRDLRQTLRKILEVAGIVPEKASKDDFKRLAKAGKLRMPSGVPIRTVKVLQRIQKPVKIKKLGLPTRFYLPGSNHHMEIVEDAKTGEWSGECIRTFDAARRIRPPNGEPAKPMLNKDHGPGKKFVMSLAEGETIYARRQDRPADPPSYYIVAKLEKTRIHFKPHNDAHIAKEQDRWGVSPADLRSLAPTPDTPPYKVRVSPLGSVERIDND